MYIGFWQRTCSAHTSTLLPRSACSIYTDVPESHTAVKVNVLPEDLSEHVQSHVAFNLVFCRSLSSNIYALRLHSSTYQAMNAPLHRVDDDSDMLLMLRALHS